MLELLLFPLLKDIKLSEDCNRFISQIKEFSSSDMIMHVQVVSDEETDHPRY